MTSALRGTTLAVATAATLLLAGCFAPAPVAPVDPGTEESAPEPDVAPASGETIAGTGYSFQVPEGWTEQDAGAIQAGLDTVAIDATDDDGFSDNVNVILSPAGELSADQIEQLAPAELEGSGATDVELLDRVTIDGSESPHVTGIFTASGATYRIDQYYPTTAGQTFIVTFSYNETVPQDERDAVAFAVLASWQFD